MGKNVLTEQQVAHIFDNWHGNKGGRRSLYSLCQEHGISIDEAYVLLRTSRKKALKKARKGQKFVRFNPVAERNANV